jgi:four helix bundle protein
MNSESIKSFEDLVVWQKSDKMWQVVCEDVLKFPNSRIAWILTDQLVRSVGSISANIAEGYGAGYNQEFIRCLKILRKECTEALNWLIKAERLHFVVSTRLDAYRSLSSEILKMLNSIVSKLNSTR